MEFAGHKKIKNFSISGEIFDDSDFIRLRHQYETYLDKQMRLSGYIPHLDLDPVFSTSYNGKIFEFKLTYYGVYVGKKKAKCYTGITCNQLVPMIPMTQNKSEKLFRSVEST